MSIFTSRDAAPHGAPTPDPSPPTREQVRAKAIADAEAKYGLRLICIGEGTRSGTTRTGRVEVRVEMFVDVSRSGLLGRKTFGRYETQPDRLVAMFDESSDPKAGRDQVSETFYIRTAQSARSNTGSPAAQEPERLYPPPSAPVAW
jgi:hypothetical protein